VRSFSILKENSWGGEEGEMKKWDPSSLADVREKKKGGEHSITRKKA